MPKDGPEIVHLPPVNYIAVRGRGDRNAEGGDCLVPGRGSNDFAALRDRLQAQGFRGAWILELYRQNFGAPSELAQGRRYLQERLEG